MIKPKKLQKGDKVAIVSLSSGLGGEEAFIHRYEIGKQRLESVFGLEVVTMPNALKGIEYLYQHPEVRAKDLMEAFQDNSVKAIICMIGGEDTIRLLPYVDFDVIRNNPKIFMGYSDTTANHFMMYKAGLVSYYGASILTEFAENVQMHDYTVRYIQDTLFSPSDCMEIESSRNWTSEMLEWADKENSKISRTMVEEKRGHEFLQGTGVVRGKLLGGCLSVLMMIVGTDIWPKPEEWENTILFLETAEDFPDPSIVRYFLRNLVAQGIIGNINGIMVGKPLDEKYYNEYKMVFQKVIGEEAGRKELPIVYNMNFGHASPICVIPYGIEVEIDCESKKVMIKEPAVDIT